MGLMLGARGYGQGLWLGIWDVVRSKRKGLSLGVLASDWVVSNPVVNYTNYIPIYF